MGDNNESVLAVAAGFSCTVRCRERNAVRYVFEVTNENFSPSHRADGGIVGASWRKGKWESGAADGGCGCPWSAVSSQLSVVNPRRTGVYQSPSALVCGWKGSCQL